MTRASLSQAASLLGCSTAYLRRLCLDGRIQGARKGFDGRLWQIPIPMTILDARRERPSKSPSKSPGKARNSKGAGECQHA